MEKNSKILMIITAVITAILLTLKVTGIFSFSWLVVVIPIVINYGIGLVIFLMAMMAMIYAKLKYKWLIKKLNKLN